jgi:hypothetical protein
LSLVAAAVMGRVTLVAAVLEDIEILIQLKRQVQIQELKHLSQ